MTTYSTLRAACSAALRRTPLTLRSILLLLFCGYLLLGPVPHSSDIVAASLAYGLLSLFGVIALLALVQGSYMKRGLAIEFHRPDEPTIAGSMARCIVTFSKARLVPGMVLECRISCPHPGIQIPTIKFFRGTTTDQRVAIDVMVPHRGNWEIHGISCTVGDLTGFIRTVWTIPLESSIVVLPPAQPDNLMPLVSSTQRAGDLVSDAVHRLGDPFDIKPYHPSDGVKKIVWKAFAKSGELLSRHAEASMTPEGFVALFVLAQPEDDDLCGKALTYVRTLKGLTLDLLLGCEGHNGRPLGHDLDSSQELLVDATWDARKSRGTSLTTDLQALLDACTRTGVSVDLRRIVIFCSGARVASELTTEMIDTLTRWFEERRIEPVFFLTQPDTIHTEVGNSWSRRLSGAFFEPQHEERRSASANKYQRFLSTCLSKQWEVFV